MTRPVPEQAELATCGLCAELSIDVVTQLVEWSDDAIARLGLPRYQSIERCRDRVACRRRVETVLEVSWPVNDRTPAPPAPERPQAAPVDAEGMGGESLPVAAGLGPHGSRLSPGPGSKASALPATDEDIEWLR